MGKSFIGALFGCLLSLCNAFAATSSSSNLSIPVVPALAVIPAILTTSGSGSVTVVNQNPTASVPISSIVFSGANAGDFSVSSTTCSSSLAAASSCTVNISFTGSGASETVSLNITSSTGHIVTSSVIGGASSTSTCDIGPSYTGSIPPGAVAAGFTHCAANYDFTTSAYATLSSWLDVCGASSPQWYATSSDGSGNPAPCSAWTITTDGGSQVLQMHWDSSFNASSVYVTGMQTKTNPTTGQDFPQGAYFEATFRNTTTSFGDERNSGSPFIMAWWAWQFPPSGSGVVEWDFLEVYAFAASLGSPSCGAVVCQAGSTWHNWANNSSNEFATYAHPNVPLVGNYDPTTYQTIGTLVTNDGFSTIEGCQYLNNVGVSCGGVSPNANQYSNRSYLIMYSGPQNNGGVNYNPSVPQDLYVKSVRVFTCAGGLTGQCRNSPVISSP